MGALVILTLVTVLLAASAGLGVGLAMLARWVVLG